jgi:predicted GH43/DUF377 family glycosyl hydrolase
MKHSLLFRQITASALFAFLPFISVAQQTENKLPNWAFGGFVRPTGVNPVIVPDSLSRFPDPLLGKAVDWESNDTFNPAATLQNGRIIVLYRAEDKSGSGIGFRTSRLGYAESMDGLRFKRRSKPVFFPANDDQKANEWPGGTEDPRIAVTAGGTYVIFYTQWNRKIPRLGVATSKDLLTWKKHGPIFEHAKHGNLATQPHKSASILTRLVGGKQVIAKVNGKYWMYWGETGVYGATSDNLVDWEPVVDSSGKPIPFISPRPGYFDSALTECGPPAILTSNGILLLYNGKNDPSTGDKRFNPGTYSAGQVLFDKNDPGKAIGRLDLPFLRPMEAFEKSGQYTAGTVFIEGMVFFRNKWFLYYGCADSKVGVAIYDPEKRAAPDPLPILN